MAQSHGLSSTILIVEDEVLIRDCVVAQLEEAGFGVVAAKDAEEALRTFEQRPDVTTVFTDVKMPGRFDGIRLADLVFKLRPGVRVIITSGLQLKKSGLPAGARFLPKPYDCGALPAFIKAA